MDGVVSLGDVIGGLNATDRRITMRGGCCLLPSLCAFSLCLNLIISSCFSSNFANLIVSFHDQIMTIQFMRDFDVWLGLIT